MADLFSRLANRIMRYPSDTPIQGAPVEADISLEGPGPKEVEPAPGRERRVEPSPPRAVPELHDDRGPRAANPYRLEDHDAGPKTHQPASETKPFGVTNDGEEIRSAVVPSTASEVPMRPSVVSPKSPTPRIVEARPRLTDPNFVLGGEFPIPDSAPDPGPNVEIHIGRLEVRATLEPEKPSLPRPRADARPEPLALEDYLSGRKAST